MPKTVVGLFEKPGVVDDVVREIEALGFPRNEVRTFDEPSNFNVTGVMSFPRLDFEVALLRSLTKIGAPEADARIYLNGLRRGGAMVLATGSDWMVADAASIMSRHGAVEIEQEIGDEPNLPGAVRRNMTPEGEAPVQAGRIRQTGGAFFVW